PVEPPPDSALAGGVMMVCNRLHSKSPCVGGHGICGDRSHVLETPIVLGFFPPDYATRASDHVWFRTKVPGFRDRFQGPCGETPPEYEMCGEVKGERQHDQQRGDPQIRWHPRLRAFKTESINIINIHRYVGVVGGRGRWGPEIVGHEHEHPGKGDLCR